MDVIKVYEKFRLYGNGLFLLEPPLGQKNSLSLWLGRFYFIFRLENLRIQSL